MSFNAKLDDLPWEPVRANLTTGVWGRTLLDGDTKAVYTRVEPGGEFRPHVDRYGHLMLVLSGSGTAHVAGKDLVLEAGTVVGIDPGELHSYRNTGEEYLVMVTLNLTAHHP
ncbi:hypothetical protein GMSM_13320 [Geomonas sp. Red276]